MKKQELLKQFDDDLLANYLGFVMHVLTTVTKRKNYVRT